MELLEELRAGEVDAGARAEEEDREPHALPPRVQQLVEAVPDVLHVEVEEGGLGAEDEDVGEPLVLGVPDHVGEVVRAAHAAELRGARPGGAPQDQQQRDHDADQDAPQEAGAEHAEERGDGHAELASA